MTAKTLVALLLTLIAIGVVTGQSKPFSTPSTNFEKANKQKAVRLWELAVEAKGGRERLKSVKNMVVTSDAVARWSLFKTFKIHTVSVYEFPWRWWWWNDQRNSVFGISEEMYNGETGKKYYGDPRSKTVWKDMKFGDLIDFEPNEPHKKGQKMNGLMTELLVLSWIEPTVLGTYTEGKADIIRTELNGGITDFALDRKTHLPQWWKAYKDDGLAPNGVWMKDYKDFGGIMMATHEGSLSESGRATCTYQFNVEIEPSIWKTPPPYSLGDQGWRKQ